jgi:hypothetical protein
MGLCQSRLELDRAAQQTLRLLIVLNGRLVEVLHSEMEKIPCKTLDKFKVPTKEQEELITIVGSTKKDIVKTTPNSQCYRWLATPAADIPPPGTL